MPQRRCPFCRGELSICSLRFEVSFTPQAGTYRTFRHMLYFCSRHQLDWKLSVINIYVYVSIYISQNIFHNLTFLFVFNCLHDLKCFFKISKWLEENLKGLQRHFRTLVKGDQARVLSPPPEAQTPFKAELVSGIAAKMWTGVQFDLSIN